MQGKLSRRARFWPPPGGRARARCGLLAARRAAAISSPPARSACPADGGIGARVSGSLNGWPAAGAPGAVPEVHLVFQATHIPQLASREWQ
jgi:hypothetical protein